MKNKQTKNDDRVLTHDEAIQFMIDEYQMDKEKAIQTLKTFSLIAERE